MPVFLSAEGTQDHDFCGPDCPVCDLYSSIDEHMEVCARCQEGEPCEVFNEWDDALGALVEAEDDLRPDEDVPY